MVCTDGPVYPLRFLLIFALDVVSSITDLIIFICMPKILNEKKRLKMARQADIEQMIISRRETQASKSNNEINKTLSGEVPGAE